MKAVLDSPKGKLVVSCQALGNKPLHNPSIMSRIALAAAQGDTVGIRTNSVVDIRTIKEDVSLPMIGVIKHDYPGNGVFIMAILQEVGELMTVESEIITPDATTRPRPREQSLEELVTQICARYPSVLLMADIATIDEAATAERLDFDRVGIALYDYTAGTVEHVLAEDDCSFLRDVLTAVSVPVVVERNVDTPKRTARCLALGAHTVVVGGAITHLQQITARFIATIAS